ncbi:unnamed protein product [Cercospora beticola]|nr:unnamed protein product [Cercospora beticola]
MSFLAKRVLTRQLARPTLSNLGSCRSRLLSETGRRRVHASATEFLQNGNVDWTESQQMVRESIAKIASKYDDEYWKDLDSKHKFSLDLHSDLAGAGWLGICMPEEYGGSALGISEASVMMQTLSESGGGMAAASSVHMNIFGLEPVVKFATEEQKKRWLVPLIAGEERACFGVTEPNTGLDTLKLQSLAKKNSDGKAYSVSGSKIWTSTAQTAQKILLLVRTTPLAEVKKATQGLSLFYTDLDRSAVQVQEIEKLGRAAVDSNTLFFDGWQVPAEDLIGSEGDGFKQIMHGMNAERVLIAAEALGLGFASLRKAALYAQEREVFGRPIGKNQGIQHPLADSWMKLEAARLITYQAARMYDQGHSTGEYANACKYLAADAAFEAAERAVLTHGGMGYAKEYHVERYFREAMLPRLAPVSREMILNYVGERVLGLPRSY